MLTHIPSPLQQFRLLHTLPSFNPQSPPTRRRGDPTHLLIILGSGGHTAEMLSLLQDLDTRSYTHRTYVISSGDSFSALKAQEFESRLADTRRKTAEKKEGRVEAGKAGEAGTYSIRIVPRARRIHQSALTAPWDCLRCLLACLHLLTTPPTPIPPPQSSSPALTRLPTTTLPDLILLNGPATATILVIASLLLRFVGWRGSRGKMRSIYIESWARVRKLSLSGRILVAAGACERVLVQWEGLREGMGGRGVEFRGCLVR
jgi:beta-1,4-N-acetylglucosaminyltransferase